MKTMHQQLILATVVAAALGLSACNKNENPPADTGTPSPAMSAQPAMPPVTEPPPMMAPTGTSMAPAMPATTGSVH